MQLIWQVDENKTKSHRATGRQTGGNGLMNILIIMTLVHVGLPVLSPAHVVVERGWVVRAKGVSLELLEDYCH